MKSTGIVRRIDELGRIVIPKELRTKFELDIHDSLEIFTDGEDIVLKKFSESCIFCGDNEGLLEVMGRAVCPKCLSELKK